MFGAELERAAWVPRGRSCSRGGMECLRRFRFVPLEFGERARHVSGGQVLGNPCRKVGNRSHRARRHRWWRVRSNRSCREGEIRMRHGKHLRVWGRISSRDWSIPIGTLNVSVNEYPPLPFSILRYSPMANSRLAFGTHQLAGMAPTGTCP